MLFLFSFFFFSLASAWKCDNPVTTLTVSTTKALFIPEKSTIPLPYDGSMNCIWQFSIPKGKMASVVVNSNFTPYDTFSITNSMGFGYRYNEDSNDIPQESLSVFYFPADPLTSIELDAGLGFYQGYLTFSVLLYDLPKNKVQSIAVDKENPVILSLEKNMTEYQYIFTSNKPYTFGLALSAPDNVYDTCFLYKGADPWTGEFLAGLNQFVMGKLMVLNYTSSVLCFGGNYPESYLFVINQPNDFNEKTTWLLRIGVSISASLSSNVSENFSQNAYLTTYCPEGCVEYLQYVHGEMESRAILSLNAGLPGDLHLLTSFSVSDSSSFLPQELRGFYKTYVLNQGTIDILIDRNSTGFQTAKAGRKGFFMTQNYPYFSETQNAATRINASDPLNFSFALQEMTLGGGTFTAEIEYKDMKGYSMLLNVDSVNGTEIAPQMGYWMSFELTQGTSSSKGGLVRFEITSSTEGSFGVFYLLLSFLLVR